MQQVSFSKWEIEHAVMGAHRSQTQRKFRALLHHWQSFLLETSCLWKDNESECKTDLKWTKSSEHQKGGLSLSWTCARDGLENCDYLQCCTWLNCTCTSELPVLACASTKMLRIKSGSHSKQLGLLAFAGKISGHWLGDPGFENLTVVGPQFKPS